MYFLFSKLHKHFRLTNNLVVSILLQTTLSASIYHKTWQLYLLYLQFVQNATDHNIISRKPMNISSYAVAKPSECKRQKKTNMYNQHPVQADLSCGEAILAHRNFMKHLQENAASIEAAHISN